ncbi:MAG: serine/threonine-protein phosphatase [Nitrospirae bacterium]|nr:serine/threonine-protein phosphatase [Nitrospirota bacterium]
MKVAWKTALGHVRENNEDAVLVDEQHRIFLLADGMGGHNAGEVASDIAVKEAHAFILKEIEQAGDERAVLAVMEEALYRAHRAVQAKAASDEALYGMGTTLVELYIRDGNAFVCHAGDSRAYLFRDTLRRITRDHTFSDAYAEHGPRKGEKVPQRMWHALTQAVGPRACPVPDTKTVALLRADILLLCSDGLTDMLGDDDIQDILSVHNGEMSSVVDALVRSANNKGGKDNISLIAVMQ